ncbi:MAG: hypothetical protein BGO43_01395 [Gammaproteobacteria bacterium 39-13]|nr:hypothetical protein [Gammaproteobacteria bacterium]OJV85959.1 MAG: hypothetical protein BGO43_01395 [Gammaproteobacteria bacterium 39-13]
MDYQGYNVKVYLYPNQIYGGVLIIVLVFSTLIALICITAMESSTLQLKMVNNFQLLKQIQQETQHQVLLLEENLTDYFYEEPPEHTDLLQFVPDTLLFGEPQGSRYYRVKVEIEQENGAHYSLSTTYGVRDGKFSSPFIAKHTNIQSSQDSLHFYHVDEHFLHKRFEWMPSEALKLSEPIKVEPPQYHFELESTQQAELYRQFKLQHANRQPIIYVMDSEGNLLGLNYQAEIVQNIDLKRKEQSLLKQWKFASLTAMDAFWENRWHTVLIGIMPSYPMKLFAFDVTFSSKKLELEDLLWQVSLPESAVVHKPTIVRFANARWGAVFTYILNHQAYVAFADVQSGNIFKEIALPIYFLSTEKTLELSVIATVDSKARGFCDEAYVGDNNGRLWKIALDGSPIDWRIAQYVDLSLGKIVGQPLIARHPEGKGVMVYLLIQTHDRRHKIVALSTDKQNAFTISFVIDEYCRVQQPLLRQGYLIASMDELNETNKIMIYDTFTGKKIKESKLTFLEASYLDPHQAFHPPFIFTNKPREKENLVVVNTTRGLTFVKMEIDYARLGRRTWETSFH